MREVERRIFVGAKVRTMWDACPQAEAICVSQGRIECLGTRQQIEEHVRGRPHQVVDLKGGVLYPGFIDTHSHLSAYSACLDHAWCGVERGSVAGVLDALRGHGAARPDDPWIMGYGYDDSGLPDNRHLTRHDLDAVSRDRPVFVTHISVHFAYANTLGLKMLGITRDSRFPGGEVGLGEDGEPSGYLAETAAFAAAERLPKADEKQAAEALVRAVAEYNRQGFTTFIDGGVGFTGDPSSLMRAYLELDRSGRLNARAWLQPVPDVMERLLDFGLWHFGSDMLRLGGVKFFIDGSIQGWTAALLQDYHGRPGHRGELLMPVREIERLVARYHELGIQVAIHVNGDAAIETALRAFEKALATTPGHHCRHMLIHAQTASDEQVARMQACGIIPSFFSRHIEVWGDRHAARFLGPERASRLDPAGSCVRLGLPFGLHVDSPVLPVTALGSMHAAVNRVSAEGVVMGEEQRISPRAALEAYTTHAALCCGGEGERGRIEPGRFADFVLLSEDLEEIAPERIRDVDVCMTVCNGRVVHSG